ncbi:MAG: tRNA (N6-threonylcarbamoyladenosine(37)-N6)-methyltransferase TrmO, partial [Candidatus Thorarchaeota archaeon]
MSHVANPIGIIRSPFDKQAGTPIQSIYSEAIGEVEIFEEFERGLKDIELFSHIFLIYWFHRIDTWKPLVTPFRDTELRGIFATRAPLRPNPIGISVVSLV